MTLTILQSHLKDSSLYQRCQMTFYHVCATGKWYDWHLVPPPPPPPPPTHTHTHTHTHNTQHTHTLSPHFKNMLWYVECYSIITLLFKRCCYTYDTRIKHETHKNVQYTHKSHTVYNFHIFLISNQSKILVYYTYINGKIRWVNFYLKPGQIQQKYPEQLLSDYKYTYT